MKQLIVGLAVTVCAVVAGAETLVPIPTASSREYTGQPLTADLAETEFYTVDGNDPQTECGDYSIFLFLKNWPECKWQGSEEDFCEVVFSITQAGNAWVEEPTIADWTYGETASVPSARAKFGSVKVRYNGTANDGTVVADAASVIKAGAYNAVFTVAESTNYKALSKTVPFRIKVALIEGEGGEAGDVSLTARGYEGVYDGAPHTITVQATGADFTVEYALSREGPWQSAAPTLTNAGELDVWYRVTSDKYATVINSKKVSISWKALTPPTIASKIYTGTAQTADVPSSGEYVIVSNEGGINAGTYAVIIKAADAVNCRWPENAANIGDGLYRLAFEIEKAPIDMTGVSWDYAGPFTYDGAAHSVLLTGLPAGVTVKAYADNTMTTAGVFTASATLEGSANFADTTAPTCAWAILPKSLDGATVALGPRLVHTGSPLAQTVAGVTTVDGFHVLPDDYVVSENRATDVGSYELKVTGRRNYTGVVVVPFLVYSTAGSDLLDDLGGIGEVTPNPDGDGWVVTVTNDLKESSIEIGDNLGNVMIDLKGHNIVGKAGSEGNSVDVPGGAGEPAIRIRSTGKEGAATHLTIIDSEPDDTDDVVGGRGGDGTPGGNGGAGVEVAGGTRDGVKVSVGAGVGVRGGDGGTDLSGNSHGGNGGAGIDGDVGTNDGSIHGGTGGDSENGRGGNGGDGVTGDVDVNNGDIGGGAGGASVNGNGGNGGDGVGGDVGVNNGDIRGGNGGDSVNGRGGTGGDGVAGNVGTNDGNIGGGAGGSSENGRGGAGGSAVGGTVGGGSGTMADGDNGDEPTITVVDGGKSGALNEASVEVPYDRGGHGIKITVTEPATGAKVRYALSEAGPYGDVNPLFTNVVDHVPVWYEVSAEGYASATNWATVTVVPLNIRNAELTDLRIETVDGVRRPSVALAYQGWTVPADDYSLAYEETASGGVILTFSGRGNFFGTLVSSVPQTRFRVAYDYNGGIGDEAYGDFDMGSYYGPALPCPVRPGYLFDGWYESSDFAPGTRVDRDTPVHAQDLTLHAKWVRRALWYTDPPFHLESAAIWDGYLVAADGCGVGTLSVKVGKPNRKTGLAKVTATLLPLGGKKLSLKGTTFDGTCTLVGADGRTLSLVLGANGMAGTFAGLAVDGARNVFVAKDDASRVRGAQALTTWGGTYPAVVRDAAGCFSGLSLTVGRKGVVRVVGTLADGLRVSGKAQLLVGQRECAQMFAFSKKSSRLAFLVWFCEDGGVELSNLDDPTATGRIANLFAGASLSAGAAFRLDGALVARDLGGTTLAGALPDGTAVSQRGAKWIVAKPGKVKMAKGRLTLDGDNLGGLRLSYTMKTGVFKGGFTVYLQEGGRLRKAKAVVNGVVLEGRGYGTATLRSPACRWPVTIE